MMKKVVMLTLQMFLVIFWSSTVNADVEVIYSMGLGAESGMSFGIPDCQVHSKTVERPHLSIRLSSHCSQVVSGDEVKVRLSFDVEDGWQLYYGPNPGDIAQRTEMQWNMAVEGMIWPVPSLKISSLKDVSYVYDDDRVVLYGSFKVPDLTVGESFELRLDMQYQMCAEGKCSLYDASLGLDYRIVSKESGSGCGYGEGVHECRWHVEPDKYPKRNMDARVQSHFGSAKQWGEGRQNFVVSEFRFEEGVFEVIDAVDLSKVRVIYDRPEGMRVQEVFSELRDEGKTLRVISRFRCRDNCSYGWPEKIGGLVMLDVVNAEAKKERLVQRFDVDVSEMRVDDLTRKDDKDALFFGLDWARHGCETAAALQAQYEAQDSEHTMEKSILWILFLAFLGGLILNVMPCVLPVLSLKALSLVEEQGSRSPQKNLVAYALGVLSSFWALALLIVILKSSGEHVGWGFQFQEPGYVLGMSSLVFVFSLSLVGIFEIPGMSMSGGGGSGWKGAFVQGIMMTALSTPCSAPLLGTALVFVLSRQSWEIFLVLSVVGLGLMTPVVLLSLIPKLRSWIPKPGGWMVTFKQVIGFLLLGTFVYLLMILSSQLSAGSMGRVYVLLLLLGIGAWVLGKWADIVASRRSKFISYAVVLILVVFGVGIQKFESVAASGEVGESKLGIKWERFDEAQLYEDMGAGRSILLDFTADWCPTCKVNEKAAIERKAVAEKIKALGVVAVKADMTLKDEVAQRWISRFGRAAIPLVVVIPHGKLEDAIVLPEIFTEGQLLDAMDAIGDGQ